MENTSFSFIIRDGLASDIPACIELDHRYETEHVWKMSLQQELSGWQISFRTERLPRSVEMEYPINAARLEQSLSSHECFLVACAKEENQWPLGYLTLSYQHAHQTATIHDLVVARPFRGSKVGSRLLSVARRWAVEHGARQLFVEMQTKNYPAIQFCQANGFIFCGFNDQYFPNQDIAVFFGQSLR